MKDRLYAVTNPRTIRENIAAYASYAPYSYDLYDKVEAAQKAIDELIKAIEENAD